jgi:hypothetical protein
LLSDSTVIKMACAMPGDNQPRNWPLRREESHANAILSKVTCATQAVLSRRPRINPDNLKTVGPSRSISLRGGEMARPGRSQFFLFYFTSLRGTLDSRPWPTSRKTAPKAPREAQKLPDLSKGTMAVKPFENGSYRPTACRSTPILSPPTC